MPRFTSKILTETLILVYFLVMLGVVCLPKGSLRAQTEFDPEVAGTALLYYMDDLENVLSDAYGSELTKSAEDAVAELRDIESEIVVEQFKPENREEGMSVSLRSDLAADRIAAAAINMQPKIEFQTASFHCLGDWHMCKGFLLSTGETPFGTEFGCGLQYVFCMLERIGPDLPR